MRKRLPSIVRLLLALALVVGLVAVTAIPASAQVTGVGFTASPPRAGAVAQYVVGFTTSAIGALTANVDTITITFPVQVTVPTTIAKAYVSVTSGGATNVTLVDPVVIGNTVILITPTAVANSAAATVTFAQVAGIKNPPLAAAANFYVGYVNTSQDTTPVASATYSAITTHVLFTPLLGPVGTPITVTGVGFAPSMSVDITDAGAVVIGTGTTTATGTFSVTAYAAPGSTGALTATDGAGNTHTTTATFTVTPTPTPTPVSVTLGATSGYPGQGITAIGNGWAPGAVISITLAGNPVTTSPATIYVGMGPGSIYPWTLGTWMAAILVPTIPVGTYTGTSGLRFTDGVFVVYVDFTVAPAPGTSEKGMLVEEWAYLMYYYPGMYFGSSAALAELGVNDVGSEPDRDLEIVTGSDECYAPPDNTGYWRAFDSQGNLEWITSTQTDEARSSPAVADIDGDGDKEIVGGTTSGWYVQVMDHTGDFVWTFPRLTGYYVGGPFAWPSSPALADVAGDEDLEVIIGNRWLGSVWCFDGDNSDGVDEGITVTHPDFPWPYPLGAEGTDWDVLWIFDTEIPGDQVIASPAVGDVDQDGELEVVVGSTSGSLFVLNGTNGVLEWEFQTGGAIWASAALANLDADVYTEIVVGSTNGTVYCLQWDGNSGGLEWPFTTGGPVYSSAAIGDVDGDGLYEIVVGSNDNVVYCIGALVNEEGEVVQWGVERWSHSTDGPVYSSPALFDWGRAGRTRVSPSHAMDWPMFRHDTRRTGFYNGRGGVLRAGLDILVGSDDNYLYWLHGRNGLVIDRFRAKGPIRTSPAVADVDGDERFEAFFYDWSSPNHTFWAVEIGLSYPRAIRILRGHRGDEIIRIDDFRDYVSGVLPWEWTYSLWQSYADEYGEDLVRESWIAGALAIKTYAWHHVVVADRHRGTIADGCDEPYFQVYRETTFQETDDVVQDTWPQFIVQDDKPFNSQYWNGRVQTRRSRRDVEVKNAPSRHADTIDTVSGGTIMYVTDGQPTSGWRQVARTLEPGAYSGWVRCSSIVPMDAYAGIINERHQRMTQYGSLYWALQGWNAEAILSHFYGDDVEVLDLPW